MTTATPTIIAFDVYGTLIDTHGVITALANIPAIGKDRAAAFSQAWRDKQLEYAFRRGLMRQYDTFATCTAQSLDYTCATHNVQLTNDQRSTLLATYARLPAFPDAAPALQQLAQQNSSNRLYAFSNGTAAAVNTLLTHAGLRQHFTDIISVDEIKTFKPHPAIYTHFLHRAGADPNNGDSSNAWLISSNPFDIIGAISAGMKAAWIKRSETAQFDPWGIEPTVTIPSLTELAEAVRGG